MNTHTSLVDAIAQEMQCKYISDLKYLNRSRRRHLAIWLSRLPVCGEDLPDWMDACEYLTGTRLSNADAGQIRSRIVAHLLD